MRRATGHVVADEQAHRIQQQDVKAFVRAVNTLNDLMERVREYEPEAELYLAMDSLHLMIRPAHEGRRGEAREDRSALSWTITHADGGDW